MNKLAILWGWIVTNPRFRNGEYIYSRTTHLPFRGLFTALQPR